MHTHTVNWGQYNPSPAPGMVRVWTWEALAHGASFVSYFRWRQADKAQEQMHTGLKRVDNSADAAFFEASQTHDELQACQASFSPSAASSSSPFSFSSSAPRQSLSSSSSLLHLPMAALVFSYEAQWMFDIDSKATGNRDVNYIKQCYDLYSALRANSFIVDVVPPRASKITSQHYDVIVVPSLLNVDDEDSRLFLAALASADVEHTPIVLGPRFASKTTDFGVKAAEDSALWSLMHIKVDRVETLRPGLYERVSLVSSSSSLSSSFSTYSSSSSASTGASKSNPKVFEVGVWKEYISVDPAYSHTGSPQVTIEARFGVNSGNVAYTDGDKHSVGVSDAAKTNGAVFKYKNRVYWSFWPTKSFMDAYIQRMCNEYSIKNCAPLTSRTQSEASDDVMDGADAEHIDTDIRLNSILVSETEVAAMMKARSRNARANSSTVKSTPVWSSDASEYQHNTKTTHMNNSQASLRLYIATNYGPEEQPYPFPLSSLPHSGENEDNKGERDDESSTGREKMVFLIGSSDSIAGYGVAVWYYV